MQPHPEPDAAAAAAANTLLAMGGTPSIAANAAVRRAKRIVDRVVQVITILMATAALSVPAAGQAAGQAAGDAPKPASAEDTNPGPWISRMIWVPICVVNLTLTAIVIQYIRLQRHRTKRTSRSQEQFLSATPTPPPNTRPSDANDVVSRPPRESMPLPAIPADANPPLPGVVGLVQPGGVGLYHALSKATRGPTTVPTSTLAPASADQSIYEAPLGHYESSSIAMIYESLDDVSPPPVYTSHSSSPTESRMPPAAATGGVVRERPPTTRRPSRPSRSSLDATNGSGGAGTMMMIRGLQPDTGGTGGTGSTGSPAALNEPNWAGIAAASESSMLADCWDDDVTDAVDGGVAGSTVSSATAPMGMLFAAHSAHSIDGYTNVTALADCGGGNHDNDGDNADNFYVDLLQHDDVVRLARGSAAAAATAALGPDPTYASMRGRPDGLKATARLSIGSTGPPSLPKEHRCGDREPTSPLGLVPKATVRLSLGAAGPPVEPGEYVEVDGETEAGLPVPPVLLPGQALCGTLFYSAATGSEPPPSTPSVTQRREEIPISTH